MHFVQDMSWENNLYNFFYKIQSTIDVEYFHRHEGFEFLYVHEGNGYCIIDDKMYTVGPHTLIFIQPFQLHFNRITVPPTYTRTIFEIKGSFIEPFHDFLPSHYNLVASLATNKIEDQVFQLNDEQQWMMNSQFKLLSTLLDPNPQANHREVVISFTCNFFGYFISNILNHWNRNTKMSSNRNPTHINSILKWIESHFKEPFNLGKLADELFLSPNYVSTLFRQSTGKTLTEYILVRRLEESRILLLGDTLNIEAVSKKCGFHDHSYFTRVFKQKFGITPKQFRRDFIKQIEFE